MPIVLEITDTFTGEINICDICVNPWEYIKPGLKKAIYIQNDKKKNQYKACPTRFDYCRDLFMGRIVNKSSNITKYSPEDG